MFKKVVDLINTEYENDNLAINSVQISENSEKILQKIEGKIGEIDSFQVFLIQYLGKIFRLEAFGEWKMDG